MITTSLTPDQASTAQVVGHYQSLTTVEARFRVLKDFLGLRPVFHWTEDRVKGHIAVCVLAAVIEAVIGNRLAAADIRDPDLPDQTISARRALAELNRIRVHHLDAGDRRVQVITRRNPLQASDPGRPRHQHVDLGQRPHHLTVTTANPECRGNTPPHAPAYQAKREQPAEVESESRAPATNVDPPSEPPHPQIPKRPKCPANRGMLNPDRSRGSVS